MSETTETFDAPHEELAEAGTPESAGHLAVPVTVTQGTQGTRAKMRAMALATAGLRTATTRVHATLATLRNRQPESARDGISEEPDDGANDWTEGAGPNTALPSSDTMAMMRQRVAGLAAQIQDKRPAWLAGDKLIAHGRRAGLGIGTTLDRIIRPAPTTPVDEPQPFDMGRADEPGEVEPTALSYAPVIVDEPDIRTIAVRAAVKQPAIFAPGHLLTALLAGGVIHIVTTFAVTLLGNGSAYRLLRSVLPVNQMVVLPAPAPGAQILPYLEPDMLYAFCRFDLNAGGVAVRAVLPEVGWSLALYTRQGDNFYAAPGQSLRPTPVGFMLEVASDKLVNLRPGVRKTDVETNQVTSPGSEGLMVIRAPIKGVAFTATALAELKRATCTLVPK